MMKFIFKTIVITLEILIIISFTASYFTENIKISISHDLPYVIKLHHANR